MKIMDLKCNSCQVLQFCILKSSSPAEIEDLIKNKSLKTYKKYQHIYLEGEKPTGIFCITKGRVKISKTNKEEKEQIIRILKPGDNFGFHAILVEKNYYESAITIEDSTICIVPVEDFKKLINNYPSINTDILGRIILELNQAEELIATLAFKSVRERVAEAFFILKKAYNHTENSELKISFSRSDLANLVGTSKETITRFITEFKNDKIIEVEGKVIYVKDWVKLKKISKVTDI